MRYANPGFGILKGRIDPRRRSHANRAHSAARRPTISTPMSNRASRPSEARRRRGCESGCFAELAFERFHPQNPAEAGFSSISRKPIPGPITEAFSARARELGVVVVLNLFERDGDRCYDTSPVIDADGELLGEVRMVHITDYECFHETGLLHAGRHRSPGLRHRCREDRGRHLLRPALSRADARPRACRRRGGRRSPGGSVGEWPDGLYEAELRVAAFQNGYFTALCNRVGPEERTGLRW